MAERGLPRVDKVPARLWLPITAGIVAAVCLWESLVCWPFMTGCQQPWEVGYARWLSFYVCLLSGPFAPYYTEITAEPWSRHSASLLNYTATFLPAFLSPYFYFVLRGRRSVGALILGALLWLFAGHLFSIGIYV